jgi:hypothetical protein
MKAKKPFLIKKSELKAKKQKAITIAAEQKALYPASVIRRFKKRGCAKHFEDLKGMPRANDPSKRLAISTYWLASVYSDIIDNSPDGLLVVDHKFISDVTEVGKKQNNFLHKQLTNLFNIQYHKLLTLHRKQYRNIFLISYKDDIHPCERSRSKPTLKLVE